MRIRIIFLNFYFILNSFLLVGQNKEYDLSYIVRIKAGEYSIGEIIEKLNSGNEVRLTYNINEIPIDEIIFIDQHNPTVKSLLDGICKNAPLEYKLINGYIILKKRKLPANYKIQGRITSVNDNQPLIGVSVYVSKNLNGAITDTNGEYSFSLKPGNYALNINSLGYEKQEININLYNNIRVDVSLIQSVTPIEEVKILGQRKFFGDMNTGRTIESIGLKEIERQNVNNAADLLHARFAGVWATKTSGLPGDHQRVRIRGLNSLFGNVDPLYVIDGVPVPIVNLASLGIADLNIHDIENVTILKEASSTALYGFQGGNGVVLIETKQGGKKEVNFSSKFGVQRFTNFYNLMGTKEFLTSLDSCYSIWGRTNRNYYPVYSDTLANTNWQDVIFQDGMLQEYQLGISGNLKRNKYYISGNYLNHHGIIARSSYKRYTLSSNITHTFNKFLNIGINYKGSYQDNQNNQDSYMGNRLIFEGINKSPCLESTPESYYINPNGVEYLRIYYNYAPLQNRESTKEFIERNNCSLLNISNALSGRIQLRFTDNLYLNYTGSLSFKNNTTSITKESDNSSEIYYLESTEEYIIFNHQLGLNYNRTFGNNEIGLSGAFRNYKDNIWWNVDSVFTSSLNELPESFYTRSTMTRYGNNGSVIRSIQSYIGHVNYNFNKKYYISFAADYDRIREGSSVKKTVFFPSVAMSWNVAREKPFNTISWLNNFDIFANWGKSGNFPLNGLTDDLYTVISTTKGNLDTKTPVISQLANHQLKHEQIEEYNIGTKFSFFNSRLSLNFVYFEKTNSNLIVQREIPLYYGGGKQYININELFNRGYEFGIELFPIVTKDFECYALFNFSTYNQIVSKLLQDTSVYFKSNDMLVPDFVIKENEPLGSIIGYKILGRWDPTTEERRTRTYNARKNLKILNADSSNYSIDANDKIILGNSVPDFTWNLYTSFRYKNFELDFIWYAVAGVEKYNATRAATIMSGTNSEINGLLYDTIKLMDERVFYESSLFVEDASFIRLKTLTLSYAPSRLMFSKVKTKFSISFENLITITKYKGYDPEATIYSDNIFTDNSIDRGAFPNPKAVYVTINLRF